MQNGRLSAPGIRASWRKRTRRRRARDCCVPMRPHRVGMCRAQPSRVMRLRHQRTQRVRQRRVQFDQQEQRRLNPFARSTSKQTRRVFNQTLTSLAPTVSSSRPLRHCVGRLWRRPTAPPPRLPLRRSSLMRLLRRSLRGRRPKPLRMQQFQALMRVRRRWPSPRN